MEQDPNQKQVQIRISDETLKGTYSNVMQATHTQEEFVLDFLNVFGHTGVLSSRVILSPGHLKRMIKALEENMRKYEERYGQVTPAEAPDQTIGFRSEK